RRRVCCERNDIAWQSYGRGLAVHTREHEAYLVTAGAHAIAAAKAVRRVVVEIERHKRVGACPQVLANERRRFAEAGVNEQVICRKKEPASGTAAAIAARFAAAACITALLATRAAAVAIGVAA